MSRITASEARGLLEAYSSVYASQELTEEQIWEEVENWVNSLLEEGYDLSEYTWEEMYEEYLNELTFAQRVQQRKDEVSRQRTAQPKPEQLKQQAASTAKKIDAGEVIKTGTAGILNNLGLGRATSLQRNKSGNLNVLPGSVGGLEKTIRLGGRSYDRLTQGNKVTYMRRGAADQDPGAGAGSGGGGNSGAGRGGTGSGSTVTPTAAKTAPTRPAAPAKPAGSAMDQWAKANPKLAATSAEKARIRGTQQTDNPLMKDMKSRLPMNSPSVQSPTVAKLGKGNQSLVSNPNAFKAATPTQAIKAAPSTSPAASGSVAPATAAIAATPKPTPVAPRQTARERVLNQSYEYDAYDLVLEYLLNNGHVETVDEAHYVMLEMEAEVIQDIVKEVLDEDAKYDRNRRRAAQRAKARNDARDRGQTGAVPGVGYVTPGRENETYRDSAGVERHTSGARMPQKDK